ncbi:hypothetical protein PV327_003962 [Microctonus hyperodae]|uniref:Uncharacterized protein n=1 Tax=Microctonus hyperodae TaxID=165561 RepID=A0AA39G5F8_MICHY|nr:hypothetical protein PV327_003962 [Microctonus hyperodae]
MNDKLSPQKEDITQFQNAQFFQDIFSEHVSPLEIMFGHVCENPKEWEQRYEHKNMEKGIYQGKVGNVDEKRYVNHDTYWTKKLERLDNAHTSEYNLHIDQVEKSIANISQSLNINNEKKNIINGDKLTDCFKMAKTHEYLACNDEVKKFIQHIDRFMYKAVRPDSESDSLWKKRTTYTELFNRRDF